MKKLIGLALGAFLCSHALADENDFRCLKSIGLKKPIRLQFAFPTDRDARGYVAYQGGTGRIAVKRTQERELREVPGGRPSEFETLWVEMTRDEPGGTYVLVTQGARLTEFRYIRKKDGKVFRFEEDLASSGEEGCEWNRK